MKKFTFPLLLALVLLGACNNDTSAPEKNAVEDKPLQNEASIDAEIAAITETVSTGGQLLSTLCYSKESGEEYQVFAHLSEGKILKVDEQFKEGEGKNKGLNSYYLNGEKVIATREYFEDLSNPQKPMFVERYSYYDAKGQVIKTKERRAEFEEQIESASFMPAEKHGLKIDRARRALNQEGEFKTTFQGIVNGNGLNYLVIGSGEDDGYTSAVRADQEDDFVRFLLNHQKECLDKKVYITFETITEDNGFIYQAYRSGGFKKD